MTSAAFLKSCFVSACANTLLLRDSSHLLNAHTVSAVVARRTTTRSTSPALTASRRRQRRNCPADSPPASPYKYRRRKTSRAAYDPDFLHKTLHSFQVHKPPPRRSDASRRSSREKLAMEQVTSVQQRSEEVMLPSESVPNNKHARNRNDSEPRFASGETTRPLTPRLDDLNLIETRSERSASTASRISNRLSLTLPIAPPNPFPSRPTPASSTSSSFPPTPLDTPGLTSPIDSNDFITAIAAQERRVLELREELSRAESDLSRLKKQWATHEAHKKRAERRNIELLRSVGPFSETPDDSTPKGGVDIDRKKALLLGQQSQQNTPERTRRRVFHGGHTRTLSLLSPTKPTGGFSVHEDDAESSAPKPEDINPVYTDRYAPVTPSQLAKRASWAPRSAQQTTAVKQIAQDFKAGLWTFVEDLRQATIGDEPITGQGMYLRGVDGNMRPTMSSGNSSPGYGGDQDTIRASGANPRPRVTTAFDETTPTPSSRFSDGQEKQAETVPPRQTHSRSKTESQKPTKRFSWTPLTMDSIDDNDWSNWDSPSVNSPRWSGTTVNGDIIPAIPEKHDQNDTPLKKKTSKSQLSSSPASTAHKLEELLPPVLNRLTPSNFKRHASDFMKEWEKSLSTPTPPPARELATMNAHSVGQERTD